MEMSESECSGTDCIRFLNCETGAKIAGRSLLDVGVQEALQDAGWDEEAFLERGGVYEWSRSTKKESLEW